MTSWPDKCKRSGLFHEDPWLIMWPRVRTFSNSLELRCFHTLQSPADSLLKITPLTIEEIASLGTAPLWIILHLLLLPLCQPNFSGNANSFSTEYGDTLNDLTEVLQVPGAASIISQILSSGLSREAVNIRMNGWGGHRCQLNNSMVRKKVSRGILTRPQVVIVSFQPNYSNCIFIEVVATLYKLSQRIVRTIEPLETIRDTKTPAHRGSAPEPAPATSNKDIAQFSRFYGFLKNGGRTTHSTYYYGPNAWR